MDALEALRDDGAHAEKRVPFAAQSREEPVPYSLPAKITSGTRSRAIAHRRVVDRHLIAGGIVDGDAAFDARHHLVLDADIGEGAAHHHFVIAAPRAVGVEVEPGAPVLDEINAGRARRLDRAGRRDVIGGDRVEEEPEDARIDDIRRPASGCIVMPAK